MRFPDWPTRLEVYLNANAHREFEAGVWDCAAFALGAIEAMTGRRVARPADVDSGVQALGLAEVGVSCARRGDVIQTKSGVLGIVALDGVRVLVVGENGIQAIEKRHAARAWHA